LGFLATLCGKALLLIFFPPKLFVFSGRETTFCFQDVRDRYSHIFPSWSWLVHIFLESVQMGKNGTHALLFLKSLFFRGVPPNSGKCPTPYPQKFSFSGSFLAHQVRSLLAYPSDYRVSPPRLSSNHSVIVNIKRFFEVPSSYLIHPAPTFVYDHISDEGLLGAKFDCLSTSPFPPAPYPPLQIPSQVRIPRNDDFFFPTWPPTLCFFSLTGRTFSLSGPKSSMLWKILVLWLLPVFFWFFTVAIFFVAASLFVAF